MRKTNIACTVETFDTSRCLRRRYRACPSRYTFETCNSNLGRLNPFKSVALGRRRWAPDTCKGAAAACFRFEDVNTLAHLCSLKNKGGKLQTILAQTSAHKKRNADPNAAAQHPGHSSDSKQSAAECRAGRGTLTKLLQRQAKQQPTLVHPE